ncbi:MAG: transcriptional regulator [Sedimentibacter sp.]|nr:transcriptional regulator [Sedimentibacter sp.]
MEKRKPTYGSAVRMAQLVAMLSQAWRPLPVEQIAERLNISLRTIYRYRKALNEQITASDGSDFLKVIKEGGKEKWYLTDQEEITNANSFRIISVFVAKSLLKFLEGTVIKDNIDSIWNIVAGQLSPSKKKQLELFDRKIRYTGFGKKNYEEMDMIIAAILRSLIHETKLQILYYSKTVKKEKYHIIHPYTLLLHRDSLYLHAYAEDYKQIRTFIVDAIKEATNTNEPFKYPSDYSPEALTEGSFGIYQSKGKKPFKVVISFKEYLWDYITSRQWHPTQKFFPVTNEWFGMELFVSETIELIPWVLAFGKEVRIIEPEQFRDTIKKELEGALRNYCDI